MATESDKNTPETSTVFEPGRIQRVCESLGKLIIEQPTAEPPQSPQQQFTSDSIFSGL